MAKKDSPEADDPDAPAPPRTGRLSRRQRKEGAVRAAPILEVLLTRTPANLATLPLRERTLQELLEARRIRRGARTANKRQIGLLTSLLQAEDMDALALALGMTEAGERRSARDDVLLRLVRWRDQLVEEGDGALQAFIEQFPDADRHAMRQLILLLKKNPTRERASRKLMDLLRQAAGV